MPDRTVKNTIGNARPRSSRGALAHLLALRASKGGFGWKVKRIGERLARGEEGGPLVEFAMVLPMMLVIVTGIFYLGIALALYLQLTNATDIGARLLSVSRGQTTDPCATTVAAVEAAAPNLKTSALSFSYVLDGQTESGTTCVSGAAYLVQGTSASVKVTYPIQVGIYGLGWNTITLKSQTTELVQ